MPKQATEFQKRGRDACGEPDDTEARTKSGPLKEAGR